ncbi:hypothetical protein MXB_839 [Myxobolus squamalis]|nr:hypothetical protein MXB_839 [Myxobolus squamalis]
MKSHSKEYKSSKEIRTDFIQFFEARKHTFVGSSPSVPHDDPTLLFTNAGMNQFKGIFLGKVDPNSSMANLKRACNSQKCIRAGGKHNDLEDVGKDVYHHTFFEMLGNWSFNDYFKKEAITFAWTLLTDFWKLPKNRFYVTYFSGTDLIPEDTEAKQFWLECGLAESQILPFGMKENFWEMGDIGPCGPCSEIHFDRLGGRTASNLVNQDDPNVLEIWNLVFMQFNREPDGSLVALPSYHVDTGMGFERVVSIIQNKSSNYDTDIFQPYFTKISEITGSLAYENLVGDADVQSINTAYRVVADHIRTLSISIADGCRPDNVGRGYVIRRILRRAIRYSHEKLNMTPGMLATLVDVVVDQLGDTFSEIISHQHIIQSIINEEEEQFVKTLFKGRIQLNKAISNSRNKVISGKIGWLLYESFGFPIDLTQVMLGEKGFSVDMLEYKSEKNKSQKKSRKEAVFKGIESLLNPNDIDHLKTLSVPFTNSLSKYEYIVHPDLSYSFPSIVTVVVAIKVEKQFLKELSDCASCLVILDCTNFYSEEGGQLADTGFIKIANGSQLIVHDVQTYNGFVVHSCSLSGNLRVGDSVTCLLNQEKRKGLMNNHTVTHILNFSLRSVIGHTEQRGSLVAHDKLRFDFLCDKQLNGHDIIQIEQLTNQIIKNDESIYTKIIPLSEAMKIEGIRAVFGETYPDPVRIVSIGISIEDALKNSESGFKYSIELCGGIHVQKSSHIGEFLIVSEESIGKGIRRVTCVTGFESVKAQQIAQEWEEKVKTFQLAYDELKCDKSSTGFGIDNCSSLSTILSNEIANISIIHMPLKIRTKLKETMNKIRNSLVDICRKEESGLIEMLVNDMQKLVIESGPDCFYIRQLEGASNSKMLDSVAKGIDAPMFLICRDAQNKKIVYYAAVPTKLSQNMSAKQWCAYVGEKTISKSGGKNTVAQGTCGWNIEISDVIKYAEEYGSQIFKNMKLIK